MRIVKLGSKYQVTGPGSSYVGRFPTEEEARAADAAWTAEGYVNYGHRWYKPKVRQDASEKPSMPPVSVLGTSRHMTTEELIQAAREASMSDPYYAIKIAEAARSLMDDSL